MLNIIRESKSNIWWLIVGKVVVARGIGRFVGVDVKLIKSCKSGKWCSLQKQCLIKYNWRFFLQNMSLTSPSCPLQFGTGEYT